jgi:hypothetical protein
MKKTTKKLNLILISVVLTLVSIGTSNHVFAQQFFGLSFGYEYFPSVELVDPIPGAEDFKIEATSWNLGAAFPLAFSKGKILVMNQINYKRTDFSYQNFPAGGTDIDQIQEVEYTFFMIDSLSKKWKMVAVVTPGLASDFEGNVSSDDFTFGAVFGFIRQMSEKFQLGFGIAYMPDFGEPLPLPFLYIDWKIAPKLSVNGILPTNMILTYKLNPKIDLGMSLKVDGNRYHGNPDKFGVDNPLMIYSEGTISPMVQIHFLKWLHLNLEGGFAFYRNFEFFDGDEKAQSLDLKQTGYLRTGLVLGL